jgi:hypothetical protein
VRIVTSENYQKMSMSAADFSTGSENVTAASSNKARNATFSANSESHELTRDVTHS